MSLDEMSAYVWDICADPDEEVEQLAALKTPYEIEDKTAVTFSKNGLMEHIELMFALESPADKTNTKNAKLWE